MHLVRTALLSLFSRIIPIVSRLYFATAAPAGGIKGEALQGRAVYLDAQVRRDWCDELVSSFYYACLLWSYQ